MTSTGMSESSIAEFMSALLTFIFAGAIVDPLRVSCCALSQSRSGLPRARQRRMIGSMRDGRPLPGAGRRNPGEKDGGRWWRADGSAGRLDLVRWKAGAVAGCQDPCADPRPALCKLGVRRAARLWRRGVQAAPAFGAADLFGQPARHADSLYRRSARFGS